MERLFSKTPSQNTRVAQVVLNSLKELNTNLLLLKGNLGAGKTTLTAEIAATLNTKNRTSSPTFVIQKVYTLNKNNFGFTKIIHIDLYRLSSQQEIEDIDLFEELEMKNTLFIIEWPEKYSFTKTHILVDIKKKEEGREFIITKKL
jgi:tRNA threonylcarbamoyladenosine biosynthesis protein TsaE